MPFWFIWWSYTIWKLILDSFRRRFIHDKMLLRFEWSLSKYFTLYVPCTGLMRVAEVVRYSYSLIDALISESKKIFVKCGRRRSLFRQSTSLPLPDGQPGLKQFFITQTIMNHLKNLSLICAMKMKQLKKWKKFFRMNLLLNTFLSKFWQA